MKRLLIHFIAILLPAIILIGCKEQEQQLLQPASLTIVNAIAGSTPLVTNFNNGKKLDYYRTAQQIPAYGFNKYTGYVGQYQLGISRLADTTKVQYSSDINLAPGSISTLYLCGTVAETEGFMQEDRIPVYLQADSLIGIRFINLSRGGPVNVVLRSPAKTMAIGLDYKGTSDFQGMKATYKDPSSYVFDFRDAGSGALLSSYTLSALSTLLSKNVTIALRGIRGGIGTSAVGTFLIPNY